MSRRTWIKLYVDRMLQGSMGDESPELVGVWVKLLCMVATNGLGSNTGEIKKTKTKGFSDTYFAELLNISRQKWASYKRKLQVGQYISIKNDNTISITNWGLYQPRYQKTGKPIEEKQENSPEKLAENLQESESKLQQDLHPDLEVDLDVDLEQSKDHMSATPPSTPISPKPKKPKLLKYFELDAIIVYETYKNTICSGPRKDTIRSICKLLRDGQTKEHLIQCIQNYRLDIDQRNIPDNCYKQSNNFFGEKAYWEDYQKPPAKVSSEKGADKSKSMIQHGDTLDPEKDYIR